MQYCISIFLPFTVYIVLSILSPYPGNPFTLQEYFGFHICKSLHPDFHVSFECLYNFEKSFMVGGHPKLSYMYFSSKGYPGESERALVK